MLFFKSKKPNLEERRSENQDNIDLQVMNKINQEFALSLDLNETLNTALKVIITRLNAQAANIFLINKKSKKFECIASLNQKHLDEYELNLTDGVMGKAIELRKCIRVGDVRKDVRDIAEFYFDLDNKTNFTTYSVLCSPLIAANDCIGVIHCLNKKTDEKLFIEDDRKLLELLSTPAALAIRNAKMAKDMIEQNKIQKEVEIVGEIQKSLLSSNKKESFPLAGINIPAKVVSGDFYNFNDLGDGKYGFGVADVSGKGIKSSLLMSKASSLYSCLSKTNFSPASLLIQLNNEICETISRGMFVTMLIGIYDSNSNELLLANAGHEPPIIMDQDDNFSNFEEAGPPLGIVKKTEYKEYKINFKKSSMYVFTDGITEIKNPEGNELGSKGFKNYITRFKDKPNNERLKLIIDNVLNSKYMQKDDLTIVVVDSK
ncbi:SpoIIE family protein phosphatase [Candidatus Pelagibacter sp.]|nr:SpoIIE family protein phosphatase [Candidatus Pelagibacter sp.]